MSKAQSSDSESLDEKIRRIRKKNEEIEKRRMEVEADKETAAKLNALVQLNAPKEDWLLSRSYSPDNERQIRVPRNNHDNMKEKGQRNTAFRDTANRPPPDPAYRFLADAQRDPLPQRNLYRSQQHSRGRGHGMRGGGRNSKSQPNRKLDGQVTHMYDAWRAERNRIDEERIRRQRTAQGHWRREWDSQKCEDDWQASRDERTREENANLDRSCSNPPSEAIFTESMNKLSEERKVEIANSGKSLSKKHISVLGLQSQERSRRGGGAAPRVYGRLAAGRRARAATDFEAAENVHAKNMTNSGSTREVASGSPEPVYSNNVGQQVQEIARETAAVCSQSEDLAIEKFEENSVGKTESTVSLHFNEHYKEPSVCKTPKSPITNTSITSDSS